MYLLDYAILRLTVFSLLQAVKHNLLPQISPLLVSERKVEQRFQIKKHFVDLMVYNNDFLFLMNDLFTYNNFFIKFSIMNKNKL